MFLRDLKEAYRLVRVERDDGYKGHFVVLRESMLEDMQITYGRVIAENKQYIKALDAILDGQSICPFCEDCHECKNHDKWLEGRCRDFMLRFPDVEESAQGFAQLYKESFERSHKDD